MIGEVPLARPRRPRCRPAGMRSLRLSSTKARGEHLPSEEGGLDPLAAVNFWTRGLLGPDPPRPGAWGLPHPGAGRSRRSGMPFRAGVRRGCRCGRSPAPWRNPPRRPHSDRGTRSWRSAKSPIAEWRRLVIGEHGRVHQRQAEPEGHHRQRAARPWRAAPPMQRDDAAGAERRGTRRRSGEAPP